MMMYILQKFSVEERLRIGAVSLDELAGLSGRSRSSLERDIKAGKLKANKIDERPRGGVLIAGPEALRYMGHSNPSQ